jgi:hypothetical protein
MIARACPKTKKGRKSIDFGVCLFIFSFSTLIVKGKSKAGELTPACCWLPHAPNQSLAPF